jgi:hypothetical protein
MIILFRHQASLGGLNILVHWLQERFGWRAGYVQLAIDVLAIIGTSLTVLAARPHPGLAGRCGAALNLTLAINHRPGPLHGGVIGGTVRSRWRVRSGKEITLTLCLRHRARGFPSHDSTFTAALPAAPCRLARAEPAPR